MEAVEPESPPAESPGIVERGWAASMYFGAAPFAWLWLRKGDKTYPAHHARQADVLFFLLFLLALSFLSLVIVLSFMMVQNRAFYDAGHYEAWTLSIFRKLFIAWVVFWIYGLGLALMGSCLSIPFVGRLRVVPGISVITRSAQLVVSLILIISAILAVNGLSMARESGKPAKACLLYEDVNGRFPRWLFALGYYPTISAANAKWGNGQVSMRCLTRESLLKAAGEAEFLFVGSHGMDAGILLTSGFLKPEEIRVTGPHPHLRFVYLAGCDSSALKKEWQSAFEPARVVTQDGLTPLIWHLWWLWLEGPAEIGGL